MNIFFFFDLKLLATVGALTGGVGALIYALEQSVAASGLEAHPAHNPWNHRGMLQSFDHQRLVL